MTAALDSTHTDGSLARAFVEGRLSPDQFFEGLASVQATRTTARDAADAVAASLTEIRTDFGGNAFHGDCAILRCVNPSCLGPECDQSGPGCAVALLGGS